MTTSTSHPPVQVARSNPMAAVGAIVAQGAIRLLDRQRRQVPLDKLTEESVSTGVFDNQEKPRD